MANSIHIVGQGLAGSLLAFSLHKKGYPVHIIDNAGSNAASKVAAGMWNPISFKRLLLSWRADEMLPKMREVFEELEATLACKLFYNKTIVKRISNAATRKMWEEKQHELSEYIELSNKIPEGFPTEIQNEFGFGIVKQAGYLDVQQLVAATKKFFKSEGKYTETAFDYQSIVPNQVYIFCEGYQAKNNPYFSWLPIIPNKGELLEFEANHQPLEGILNNNKFVFQAPNGHLKAGSTYDWKNHDFIPTEAAKDEITAGIAPFFNSELKVISHQVGLRPTVIDRRPVLGFHPAHTQLGIFNGLGTKGVMLAPFFAEQMANLIVHNEPVEEEVSLHRHLKKYYDYKN